MADAWARSPRKSDSPGTPSRSSPDEASAERARKGASEAGVLVDVESAPPTALPLEDVSVDVAIIDDAEGFLAKLQPDDRATVARELRRVLRPGGRVMIIATAARRA